jgi:hypothetical protein
LALLSMAKLGGDDPWHDLSDKEKDRREKELRKEARHDLPKRPKDARRKIARANEISRRKSKRAHRKTD